MGSYCEIRFDDIYVSSFKSHVPDIIISLFQEDERLTLSDRDEVGSPSYEVVYKASRQDVLLRLELMSFTLERATQMFEEWLLHEREFYSEFLSDGEGWAGAAASAINSFSLQEWLRRVPACLRSRFEVEQKELHDEIDRRMSDDDEDWLFFRSPDIRFVYRLILEACPEFETVTLDISDLIAGGYLEKDVELCAEARATGAIERSALEPVVIMAEGRSDIRVLQASLMALYPSVQELFSFFDHDALSVDGGAGFLLKFLKALAAARMPLRVVALFDNDGAGRLEYERAATLALPSNITVMCLPEIELARSYPTVGPQGRHDADVNGRAAGIELFLGRHNLRGSNGDLMPVHWTHHYRASDTYQGELADKVSVQAAFFEDVGSYATPEACRAVYVELNQLWQEIFAALK